MIGIRNTAVHIVGVRYSIRSYDLSTVSFRLSVLAEARALQVVRVTVSAANGSTLCEMPRKSVLSLVN